MNRLGDRLTYANVVATIALFVALGGSSYAAVTLGRHAVRARNIAPNAIDSSKVRDGSLRLRDFRSGEIPKRVAGAQGPPGPPGLPGPPGPQGGDVTLGTTATLAGPVSSAPFPAVGGITALPSLPLSDAEWIQPVGAIALMAGAATVHVPTQCDPSLDSTPSVQLVVSANREPDGSPNIAFGTDVEVTPETAGKDVPAAFAGTVFGYRSTPTPRTFELFAGDSCTGSGQRFTISDVRLTALLVVP